ncbi:MAG: shikimate kinase [Fimbriiglobus sp.]
MSRILLVGYRATGKTTLGRLLAARLEWDFVDADQLFEVRTKSTIADYFTSHGEPAFRDEEAKILADLVHEPEWIHHVVSTGGGVVVRPENREQLRGQFVVWLTAPAEVLHERISLDPATKKQRPNLTATGGLAEVQAKLAEREPWYREVSTLRFDTNRMSPERIVDRIVEEYRQ